MSAKTPSDRWGLETKLVHAGEPEPRIEGAVAMPIFQSSTFEYAGAGSYLDLKYIRLSNTPNHRVLHAKLAALEGAEAAIVTGSGMAAVSTTLLSVLRAGDHLLAQDCLYGGTHDFITQDFPALGLGVRLKDGDDPAWVRAKLRPGSEAL
jgi:O-acetylhomoserine/O-acetylserine sulfhydrylase-like pyridoxal-dependent enzyme